MTILKSIFGIDKLALSFLLLISFLKVEGQINPDLVFAKIKNGNYYVGELVNDNEHTLALKISKRDTIEINKNLLSRYYDSESALIFPKGSYIETKGSYWDVSFGFNPLGIVDTINHGESVHLEVIYGKRIHKNLNIGVGMGFEFNEARLAGFQFDTQFASFFGYGRYYLNNSSKRLFLFSRLGIGLPSEENAEGITVEHSSGFNSLNGIGMHFASWRNSSILVTLGFYTQKTRGREFFLDNIGNEIQTNFDIIIQRFIFKFGWEFG